MKTPRKNVQWAASTKGEGPMNAAASSSYAHDHQHHFGLGHGHFGHATRQPKHRDLETTYEGQSQAHVHSLDREGLDVSGFRSLALPSLYSLFFFFSSFFLLISLSLVLVGTAPLDLWGKWSYYQIDAWVETEWERTGAQM